MCYEDRLLERLPHAKRGIAGLLALSPSSTRPRAFGCLAILYYSKYDVARKQR